MAGDDADGLASTVGALGDLGTDEGPVLVLVFQFWDWIACCGPLVTGITTRPTR